MNSYQRYVFTFRSDTINILFLAKVKISLDSKIWDAGDKELTPFRLCADEFYVIDGILVRQDRIVIPHSLKEKLVKLAHEGCLGTNKIVAKLRERFWFPGLHDFVKQFVKDCIKCSIVSLPDPPQPMSRTVLPSGPWIYLGIDLFGPLPSDEHLLVVIDYYSRFFEVKILKDITSKGIIDALYEIFARLGLPEKIQSDNGPQFASKEFSQYCKSMGIILIHSPPYFPRVNGEVERQMRSLKKIIVIALNTNTDWVRAIQEFLFAYRTTPHPATGQTPASLLYNRELRDRFPTLPHMALKDFEIRDRDRLVKERGRVTADAKRRARPSEIEVGDTVLVKRAVKRSKFDSNFNPVKCKVISTKGPEAEVITPSNKVFRRVKNHLKKVTPDHDSTATQSSESDESFEENNYNATDEDLPEYEEIEDSPDKGHPGKSLNRSIEEEALFHGFDSSVKPSDFNPQIGSTPLPARPQRNTRFPAKFNDYNMDPNFGEGKDL